MTATSFSDIFSAMVTRIGGTLFTAANGYARLPNPYDVAQNNGRMLEKGWGLAVAPAGTNTQRFVCATRSMQVALQLTFTRKFYALEHDAAAKAAVDVLLLQDFEALLDDAHQYNLGVTSNNNVVVQGYFGINTVRVDETLYRSLTANFTVEYSRKN